MSPREALVFAALAVVLVRAFVPFGGLLLYPFTLFGTWAHEMGHGLAAILVGGRFESLDVFADASGLAHTSNGGGWRQAIVSAGGLLGPPILGATILASGRGPKRATAVLGALAVAMLVSLLLWVRSLTGWIAIPLVAATAGAIAWRGGPIVRTTFAQFLGVMLCLDTVFRIDYLFAGTATIGGERLPSDVATIAGSIGLHHLVWGTLLAAISLALLALGVRLAWAPTRRWRWLWTKDGKRTAPARRR